MSSDPRLTLTESQAAANYASASFQALAKKNGLDGVIVVCPAIAEFYPMDAANPHYNLRMARDNWTLNCAEPAIWELMDAITQQYAIDPDRIYGSGQSMGGMTVMAMAAQRDNYFAALLPMSCKWGNNFNKEYPFNGTSYYSMPADGKLVWQKDSDGISSSMIRRRRPSAMPPSAASCRSRMRRASIRRCSRAMSAICRPGSTVTARRPATTGC